MINIGIAVAIFVASFAIAQIIIWLTGGLKQLTKKTKTNLDDEIIHALARPIRVIFFFAGLFGGSYYLFPDFAIKSVGFLRMFALVMILVGAYVLARVVRAFFTWYAQDVARKANQKVDDTLFKFLRKFVGAVLYAIAIMILLDQVGVEIGPLLAGLGIAGLAVALALQDTLSNVFSAVYIAADRPLKIGDWIELDSGEKGYVEDIGWRSSRIRTWDNNLVVIPNSKLANTIFTNYESPEKEMSVLVPVGVAYNSDLEKVENVSLDVAKHILQTVEGGIPDFEPVVRFHTYGDSSINFNVILRVKDRVSQFLVKHEFVKALKKRFDKEGIEIPFPQRDVWMKQ